MDDDTIHGGEPDPGPPLPELAGLREPPPGDFLARLLRRLQRREAAGQVVEFSIAALLRAWWSHLAMIFEWFDGSGRPDREERDHE